MLSIPQTLIEDVTQAVTHGSLLWNKSPWLTLAMFAMLAAHGWVQRKLHRLQRAVTLRLGLDKSSSNDEEWAVEDALNDFVDMRINAKEVRAQPGL